jgi:hypothetical protein
MFLIATKFFDAIFLTIALTVNFVAINYVNDFIVMIFYNLLQQLIFDVINYHFLSNYCNEI